MFWFHKSDSSGKETHGGHDFSYTACCLICPKCLKQFQNWSCFVSLLWAGSDLGCSDSKRGMEGDTFSGLGNGAQIDAKIMQSFQKSFVQVQHIFDQNRLLINEINQNHESKVPDNLSKNVGLIRELNNNIRRVYDLYSDLSSSFTKSMEVTSEGDSSGAVKSDGKGGHKRHRPV
ncbi:hypothetical protein VNO78_03317 [Psophocarpus tetragonolobus]|uniref:Protein EARLY FLOWERING 4 domain-containing protein n=1 Tax=Psophocarpus tetragonolobus TaxID=3891 RepID=A0AAN9T0X5_PSOTE